MKLLGFMQLRYCFGRGALSLLPIGYILEAIQMQKHRHRHNELLRQLKNIQEAKDRLEKEHIAFLNDSSAAEKVTLLQSLRELVDHQAPEAARLCSHTRYKVVEKIASTKFLAEKMTAKVREIDRIQHRVQLCIKYASQLINFKCALDRFEHALRNGAYRDAAEAITSLFSLDREIIDQIDSAGRTRLKLLQESCQKQIKEKYLHIMMDKNWYNMKDIGPLIKALGGPYQFQLYQEWSNHVLTDLEREWHVYLVGAFSISELVQQCITV